MPKIYGCSQLFECGYYYDAGLHHDTTDHGIPPSRIPHKKVKSVDVNEKLNKLDIEKHFKTSAQSIFIGDKK